MMWKLIKSILIYIVALLLTFYICASLEMQRQQNDANMSKVSNCNALQQQHIDEISQNNAELSAQLDTLTAEISTLREEVKRQDKADRGGDRPCYSLTASERDLVERVVMAESGGECYEGQMLVCQCILNACQLNKKRPAEIVRIYAYAKGRPEPSDSVKRAVQAVFDRGEWVTDEAILYFYAPAVVRSKFHESQRFAIEVGGHRFFAAR